MIGILQIAAVTVVIVSLNVFLLYRLVAESR
jgi:hypothetical protein